MPSMHCCSGAQHRHICEGPEPTCCRHWFAAASASPSQPPLPLFFLLPDGKNQLLLALLKCTGENRALRGHCKSQQVLWPQAGEMSCWPTTSHWGPQLLLWGGSHCSQPHQQLLEPRRFLRQGSSHRSPIQCFVRGLVGVGRDTGRRRTVGKIGPEVVEPIPGRVEGTTVGGPVNVCVHSHVCPCPRWAFCYPGDQVLHPSVMPVEAGQGEVRQGEQS